LFHSLAKVLSFDELKGKCPPRFIRPHCNELIPLLESMALDYTFQYRSVAMQHNLEWLKLPDEIDLSNETMASRYANVRTEVRGRSPGSTVTRVGKPIIYGLSLVKDAPNPGKALEFVRLLLSDEGKRVLEEQFQEPIVPALAANRGLMPVDLQPLTREYSP